MTEITLEILNEFVDRIVVHHKEQLFGEMVQDVVIYYKMDMWSCNRWIVRKKNPT